MGQRLSRLLFRSTTPSISIAAPGLGLIAQAAGSGASPSAPPRSSSSSTRSASNTASNQSPPPNHPPFVLEPLTPLTPLTTCNADVQAPPPSAALADEVFPIVAEIQSPPPCESPPKHKPEISATQHIVSGGTAGAVARFAVAPLDVLKIRFQVYQRPYQSIPSAFAQIAKREGLTVRTRYEEFAHACFED